MLPLWHKRVQLLFSPQGAAIRVRSPVGRLLYQQSFNFTLGLERNSLSHLASIYQDLTDWFASNPSWHHGNLDVVLSQHWVHLLLQPSLLGLSIKEANALALAAFQEQYGLEAMDWHVRVDHVKPGQPALCAALHAAHLSYIEAFSSRFRMRLRSIQPSLVAVVNQHQARFSKDSVVIAILVGQYWQTIWLQAGQYRYVQSLTCEGGQEAKALESFVNRIAWQTNQAIDHVYCLSEDETTSVDFSDQRYQHLPSQHRFAQSNKVNLNNPLNESHANRGDHLVNWLECLQ